MFIDPLDEGVYVNILRHALRIADQHQHASGPSDSDVHSPPIAEETNFPAGVAPDHRDDDALLLPPLDTVNSAHVRGRQPLLGKHDLQECYLLAVGSKDGNQMRLYSVLEQSLVDRQDEIGLSDVELAFVSGPLLPHPATRSIDQQQLVLFWLQLLTELSESVLLN